jgi:hypothetical protein
MAPDSTNEIIRHEGTGLNKLKPRFERVNDLFQQIVDASEDDLFYVQRFVEDLKIIDKRGNIVSLIMNRSQEVIFHKLMECREKRAPARFICCKARQMGISTLIEAFIFALITRYPNRFALVAAHSIESAQSILAMTQRFLRHVSFKHCSPAAVSARRIEYPAPHHSRIQIDTAANRNLGRGGTLHYVHASEVAFWERPEEPVLAINQSVPRYWDTLVFWESTANGIHNLFYRTWVAAERGEIDIEPIFLSWREFPEYSLPVARHEQIALTPDEEKYANSQGLSPEQAKWACFTKKNQCHNSWEKFHQEYPAAADLAFLFTGMPWFDHEAIRDLLDRVCRPPRQRGYLQFSNSGSTGPEFAEDPHGPLWIWTPPEPGLTYSLGMDVGEGVGADYTVIQVICNETGEVVARYFSNRVRAETAGVDAYLVGIYYNFGLLGIERNGPGLATLAVCERGMADYPQITGYPNLYYHTYTDRKIPEETRRLGWITTKTTKEAMLSRLAQLVESRGLTIFCKNTLLEMQGFVWDAEKKRFQQNYKAPGSALSHDDEIMALAIANEMRAHTWENRFIPGSLLKGGEF